MRLVQLDGVQHGADKSIRGLKNLTPLEAAQIMNHAAIIALLQKPWETEL